MQGYLQLSVTVLGPGDKPVVRERRAPGDVSDAAQLDALKPQANADLVLIPPTIQRKQEFLVVSVYAVRPVAGLAACLSHVGEQLGAYVDTCVLRPCGSRHETCQQWT